MVSAHRPTLKKGHKPFKTRHATKSTIKNRNKGKIEKEKPLGGRHANSNAQKMAAGSKQIKNDRKNKLNQLKTNKNAEIAISKNLFDGKHGAPKIVTVIPLCDDCNAAETLIQINESVEATTKNGSVPSSGIVDTTVDRFKQKIKYIIPKKNFVEILDSARIADFVVFLLSPSTEVDEFGELCIRAIESQGVSNVVPLICNISAVGNTKKQNDVRASLMSYFTHFFPTTEKIYATEIPSEALNVARLLCQKFPQGVTWRDSRPYILGDNVYYDDDSETIAVEGVLRGQGINCDRLIHIPEFGDFQIDRVETVAKRPQGTEIDVTDDGIIRPTENQDSVDNLMSQQDEQAGEDEEMEDGDLETREQTGIRMDGYDYMRDFSDDEGDEEDNIRKLQQPRKLPKGMSEYQAAWIFDEDLDDNDEEEEEEEEEEEAENDMDMDSNEDDERDNLDDDNQVQSKKRVAFSEYAPTEGETEMHTDLDADEEARQLKEYRAQAKEDREFPDEIELHPNESGKERLRRYRGVKSLRTTRWDPYERDERTPQDWTRLARVPNFKATKNRVIKEAITEAQVQPGQLVRLFIRAPRLVLDQHPDRPFIAFGLLHYEQQLSVMNYSITPNSEYDLEKHPIPAKTELIMQCGPRRVVIKPLFSQSGSNSANGVYKYERFLQPGRPSTATLIAPLTFGNVPVLFFRDNGSPVPSLVGTGSVMDANANRVLSKRSVITGHPLKIHKKLVTIRYMFFNPEDVMWFKQVPLFTKSGRSGYIKESLGTHGYFKATFDGRMTSQDTVGMALYKRVWPRYSTMWTSV